MFLSAKSASCIAVSIAMLLINEPAWVNEPAPHIVIPPGPPPGAITARERKTVDGAIQRGVAFLRKVQLPNGTFGDALPAGGEGSRGGNSWPIGYAALGALALRESGVPANDPAIDKAASLVRQNAPALKRTYEVSLAILLLDRLGKADDSAVIRSLALRLMAAQTELGGWGYFSPVITQAQEKKVLKALRERKAEDVPKKLVNPNVIPKGRASEQADNSNTQFAILALWAVRKHDLPVEYVLGLAEQRFRSAQRDAGWGYNFDIRPPYGSMTCVGLLALSVGRASVPETEKLAGAPDKERPADEGIGLGLRALAGYMNDPSDSRMADPSMGPKGKLNLYFLWSVERVGVLLNLKTIGGKDWYRWGMEPVLATQNRDGSWTGRGNGGTAPVIDTSMALLFLKKSDLFPDLRETLQKHLTITDPAFDKAIGPKGDPKNPIDKKDTAKDDLRNPLEKKEPDKDLKNPIEKKDPKGGDKKPSDKGESMKEAEDDAPFAADLGELKAKQSAKLPLRVRGPAAFHITGVRGSDVQLKVSIPPQKEAKEVHELSLTVYPGKTGAFERTIYLTTDIPGRAEVVIEIRATAVR